MLDVSDGLVRDGTRLGRASGVVLEVDLEALEPDLAEIRAAVGASAALDCVLAGGEEHSLLATFPAAVVPPGWRVIGRARQVAAGERPGVLVDGSPVVHTGWDHFRSP